MPLRRALLLPAILVGCGGSPSTPPVVSAPTTPAASPAAPTECLASIVVSKPAAPTEKVGSITMRLTKQPPSCAMEMRRGTTPVVPAPACGATKDLYMKSAGDAACSIGGDVLLLTNPDAEKTGTAELDVLHYTKPDPKADLALICAPFSAIKNPRTGKPIEEKDIDPSQKARIRAQWLEESMTSAEWRSWLAHFPADRNAALAKLRASVQAASITSCEAEWLKEP